MSKRLISRALCLLLIMLLPLTAFAEVAAPSQQQTFTLSVTAGDDLSAISPAIPELLNILSLQSYSLTDNDAFGLSVLLDGTDVLSLNGRASEDGFFFQLEQLYEKILYVSAEDIITATMDLLKSEDIDEAILEQFSSVLSAGMVSSELPTATEEAKTVAEMKERLADPAIRQELIAATGGDDTFVVYMDGLIDRMVETEGEFTGEDHDPATLKTEVTFTQDDVVAMMETTYVKQQLKAQLTLEDPDMTEEELEKALSDLLAEVNEEVAASEILAPLTMLSDGEDIVFMSMPMSVVESSSSVEVKMDYRRLTTDGDVNHHVQMSVAADGEAAFTMDGTLSEKSNGNYELALDASEGDSNAAPLLNVKGIYEDNKEGNIHGLLSVLVEGEMDFVAQFTSDKTETGKDSQFSLYIREASANPLTLAETDKPLVTINLSETTAAPDGRLDGILAATSDSAVDVLKLSSEEMETFTGEIMTNAQSWIISLISQLPPSVLELIFAAE